MLIVTITHLFNKDSRLKLEQEIHDIIKSGMAKISLPQNSPGKINKKKITAKNLQKKHTTVIETEPVGDLFLKQKPFPSLLPMVTLFLEQEPVSSLAMNLDVNYCRVNQENYNKKWETEKTMQEMIFIQDGDSFQNSPIDLVFYKKKYNWTILNPVHFLQMWHP